MIIEWGSHLFSADTTTYPAHPRAPYRPGDSSKPSSAGRQDPVADHLQSLDKRGVDRGVVVQPEPYGDDHRLIVDALRRAPDRLRGTALFYPDDPEASAKLRALVADEPRIVGVRLHHHRGGYPYFPSFEDPGVRALWHTIADLDLVVVLHISPNYAEQVVPLIVERPEAKVLIDHLGEPAMGSPEEHEKILELAQYPNVWMRLSCLQFIAEDRPLFTSAKPLTKRVVEAFGPERMIWGGGTPAIVDEHLADYTEAERDGAKGGNAARLIGWE